MFPLPALLLNRWTLRIGAGVLAAGLLFGYGVHQRRKGRGEGKQQADATWSDTLEKIRAGDRAELDRRLADADQRIAEADGRFQASLAREASMVAQLRLLSAQRQTVSMEVDRLADSALHGNIIRQLNLRPPKDLELPGYTPTEERAIAHCVGEYPICVKENENLKGQIAEVKGQVEDVKAKVDGLTAKNEALISYTRRLEGYYTALYNSLPRKKRSGKCLWLWQCGHPKPLAVPAPLDLNGLRP